MPSSSSFHSLPPSSSSISVFSVSSRCPVLSLPLALPFTSFHPNYLYFIQFHLSLHLILPVVSFLTVFLSWIFLICGIHPFSFFSPPALVVLPIESVFRFSESRTEWGLSHGLTKQRAWLPSLLYDCTGTETEAFTCECAAGRQNNRSPSAMVEACLYYETAAIIKLLI